MRSRILLPILSLTSLLAIVNVPAQDVQTDFRQSRWGTSIDNVRKAEATSPLFDEDVGQKHVLVYEDNVLGLSVYVSYVFVDNKLVRAQYVVATKHSNQTDYLSDHDHLQSALVQKYGKSVEQSTTWKNDLFRDDPSNWGMAVAMGHLTKFTKWETPTTVIGLALTGEDYEVKITLAYLSKQLAHLEDAIDRSGKL